MKISKIYMYSVYFIVLFFYIFRMRFVFLPYSPVIFYAIFGFLIQCAVITLHITRVKVSGFFCSIISCFFLIYILLFTSFLFNNTFDKGAISHITSNLVVFFASFLVVQLLPQGIMTRDIFKIYVSITTFQCLLTIISFFYEPLFDIFQSILITDYRVAEMHLRRAMGFGFGFDMGTMILSFSMLMLLYLYLSCRHGFGYLVLYLVHFFVGVFVARTIFVGFIMSIVFLIFYPAKQYDHKYLLKKK
jgi:hypothetical protein